MSIQSDVATADEARARLRELFRTRGPDVTEDTRNFDALLRDSFAGQFRRERGTLLIAAQQGLPARLRRASAAAGPGLLLLGQLAESLRDDAGLDIASARWVSETFAEILRPELLLPPAGASDAHTPPPSPSVTPPRPSPPRPAPPPARETPRPNVPPPSPPAPPPDGGRTTKKAPFALIGVAVAVVAGLLYFFNASNSRSVSMPTPTMAPFVAATPALATAAPRVAPVSPVATQSCSAPNAADYEQMNSAIASFHQAAVEKDWALADKYENPSTYQGQAGFLNGYAQTAESTPTILKHNGCSVTVALRYKNINDPQHYCIDEEYTMEYSQRWKIRTARSVSPRTSC